MLHHMNRAASKVPSGAYVNTYASTANATSYTFNTSDIGAADDSRRVVVVVMASSSNTSARTLSSLTIGGVTATIHVNVSSLRTISIASLAVSTGTTANIVATMSGACNNCTIVIYRLVNFASAFPQSTTSNTQTATSINANVVVSEKSFVIAGVIAAINTNTTATWTNVTEDLDTLNEGSMRTTASDTMTAGNSVYTVTCTASASVGMALAALSWR